MKKKHVLILLAALVLVCAGAVLYRTNNNNRNDEMFSLSLESLMDGESPYGKCRGNNDNDCCIRCSNEECGALYYASGHGDAYDVTGNCLLCGTAF